MQYAVQVAFLMGTVTDWNWQNWWTICQLSPGPMTLPRVQRPNIQEATMLICGFTQLSGPSQLLHHINSLLPLTGAK
jgi:hypothetical protein